VILTHNTTSTPFDLFFLKHIDMKIIPKQIKRIALILTVTFLFQSCEEDSFPITPQCKCIKYTYKQVNGVDVYDQKIGQVNMGYCDGLENPNPELFIFRLDCSFSN